MTKNGHLIQRVFIYMKKKNKQKLMEEIEQENNNVIHAEQKRITIKASEITKKFKSLKDRQGFSRELSTLFFIIYRFIFPHEVGFD